MDCLYFVSYWGTTKVNSFKRLTKYIASFFLFLEMKKQQVADHFTPSKKTDISALISICQLMKLIWMDARNLWDDYVNITQKLCHDFSPKRFMFLQSLARVPKKSVCVIILDHSNKLLKQVFCKRKGVGHTSWKLILCRKLHWQGQVDPDIYSLI